MRLYGPMSFNRQKLQGVPYRLTDMYQQEAASGGRKPASGAPAVPLPVRRYRFMAGTGDIVETEDTASGVSVPHTWQPSTILNVKIVDHKSPTANCAGSTSVGRSPSQQRDATGDKHYRSGAVYMQPVSYHHLTNPAQFSNQMQQQSGSVTAGYPPAVVPPTCRVQCSPEVVASSKQTVNCRLVQKDGLPQSSNRESVLQMLNEELQQQKAGNTVSSLRTYVDNLRQTVVKPAAVKPQPGIQRFHPLMSSSPLMQSSTSVPSTTEVASRETPFSILYSALPERTQDTDVSSFGTNFASTERSLGSCQPNVPSGLLSSSGITDAFHPYLPISQSVSISQSQFRSPDRSSEGTWQRAAAAASKRSFYNPAGQSSLISNTQHIAGPSLPATHCSPIHSYQSHSYISKQHSIGSPLNYSSSMYQSLPLPNPQSQTLSGSLQSADLVSLQHISPSQQKINSPAKSYPPVHCSQQDPLSSPMPPYHMSPQNFASDMQFADVTALQPMSSGVSHALSSPVSPRCSRVPTIAESPKYNLVHRDVGIQSNTVSALQPPRRVPSTTLSSPRRCSSTASLTSLSGTDTCDFQPSSSIAPNVRFAATSSVQKYAAGLRQYRVTGPSKSVLPPLTCRMHLASSTLSQYQGQQLRVLPPASEKRQQQASDVATEKQPKCSPVLALACDKRRVVNHPRNRMFYQQPSDVAAVATFTTPSSQKSAPVKVSDTPNETPFSTMVSPSNFFVQGGLDFDTFIGKPIGLPQIKAESSVSSAVTGGTKPNKSTTSFSSTVSPSKFFVQGSLDFDAFIEKSIGFPEIKAQSSVSSTVTEVEEPNKNTKVVRSECSAPSAATKAAKRNKKPQSPHSPVCAGVKRKLDQTTTQTGDDSKWKTPCSFVDKYAESVFIKNVIDTTDSDPAEDRCSANLLVPEKESKVNCYFDSFFT